MTAIVHALLFYYYLLLLLLYASDFRVQQRGSTYLSCENSWHRPTLFQIAISMASIDRETLQID